MSNIKLQILILILVTLIFPPGLFLVGLYYTNVLWRKWAESQSHKNKEKSADNMINRHLENDDDLELATTELQTIPRENSTELKNQRFIVASSLAHLAYQKFGGRQRSGANLLVTRKWMAKSLEGKVKPRDANIILEQALILSFVDPIIDLEILTTSRYQEATCHMNMRPDHFP
jgi:hypothetical protein